MMHCLWNLYSRIDASLCWDRSSTALASKPSSNATNRCSPFFTQTGSHQVLSAPTYMAECLTGVSAGTAKANQVRYFSWPAYLLTYLLVSNAAFYILIWSWVKRQSGSASVWLAPVWRKHSSIHSPIKQQIPVSQCCEGVLQGVPSHSILIIQLVTFCHRMSIPLTSKQWIQKFFIIQCITCGPCNGSPCRKLPSRTISTTISPKMCFIQIAVTELDVLMSLGNSWYLILLSRIIIVHYIQDKIQDSKKASLGSTIKKTLKKLI